MSEDGEVYYPVPQEKKQTKRVSLLNSFYRLNDMTSRKKFRHIFLSNYNHFIASELGETIIKIEFQKDMTQLKRLKINPSWIACNFYSELGPITNFRWG